jgi:hypothetical protein
MIYASGNVFGATQFLNLRVGADIKVAHAHSDATFG